MESDEHQTLMLLILLNMRVGLLISSLSRDVRIQTKPEA